MTTPTTDAQVAALRALLVHDTPTATRLTAALGDAGTAGYQRLADAALSIAAIRRFAPRFTTADIVRYVASVRISRQMDGAEYDFDPAAGENVLRYSLGETLSRTPDPAERFRAVIALLAALTETELSMDADVNSLLAEARALADPWYASD
jgi:hypothetical protein